MYLAIVMDGDYMRIVPINTYTNNYEGQRHQPQLMHIG